MDIRDLEYFVAVAEELGFSRAAARVHISQPPLSRRIAKLEQELGAVLLLRSAHGVALTPAGKALLEEARGLLAHARSIPGTVARAQRGESGTLSIGFVGSTIYTSVPELLSRYKRTFPQVSVSIQQLTMARQVAMLKSREIDIGIIRQPFADPELVTRNLFEEGLLVAVQADHPLSSADSVDLALLVQERFVFFSRSEAPANHDLLSRMCEAKGFTPNIVQEAFPLSTVVGLVAAGVGIAFVPESMRRLNVRNVCYVPLTGTQVRFKYFLAWHARNDSPTLRGFLALEANESDALKRAVEQTPGGNDF